MLWFNNIFPALFPCIIISNILIGSNLLDGKNNICTLITLVCGFCFGFPIGAKLTADFYKQKYISKSQAQILLSHTNQLSPVFVGSYVLADSLGQKKLLPLTYIILYGPYLIGGLIRLYLVSTSENNVKKTTSRFKLNMQIIDAGILNGFESLIKLCGYIILFSIIVHIVNHSVLYGSPILIFLTGILEVTNGINILALSTLSLQLKYIIAIALLSFGGLCCIIQTKSIIQSTDLSLKKYIIDKITYSIVSVIIILICILFFLFN